MGEAVAVPMWVWGIIVGFAILWIGIGVAYRKYAVTTDRYLLGSRQLGLSFGLATCIATWVTGNTVLAAPEAGYTTGVLGTTAYAFAGGFGLSFFAPLAWRIKRIIPEGRTIGDFFRLRYDKKNYYFLVLNTIVWDVGWLVTTGFAAGILLRALFGVPYEVGLIATSIIVFIYVSLSGFVGVIYTDFIQCLMILIGVVILTPVVYTTVGFETVYNNLLASAEANYLLDLSFPMGIILVMAYPLLGIGEVFMDNVWWSRAYAIHKNNVFWAFMLGGIFWAMVPVTTGAIGMMGRAFPDMIKIAHVNEVYPTVAKTFLPGIGAVVVMMIVYAAITSTYDSILMAGTSIFMVDVYQRFINKHPTDRQFKKVAVMINALLVILTILLSLPVEVLGGTLLLLLFVLGIPNAAYIFPVTCGIYWKKVNRHGAFFAALIPIIFGLYWFFAIDPWQAIIITAVLSFLITVIPTLIKPHPFDWKKLREVVPKV